MSANHSSTAELLVKGDTFTREGVTFTVWSVTHYGQTVIVDVEYAGGASREFEFPASARIVLG